MRVGHAVIRPESSGLSAGRRLVSSVARDLNFSEEDAADLMLAVGEAISNAYLHGTPDCQANFIYIGWSLAGDTLTVTVKDEGPGFVPYASKPDQCGIPSPRGNGIRLMRESMDQVYFDYEDGAKVVLKKRIRLHKPADSAASVAESPGALIL